MSVKVGVRVRPFNKRQQQMECKKCVQMQGNTTHITDSEGNLKSFVYDYSFWSHDKYMVDPDGIYIAVDQKYADQQRVYNQIGSDILINAWEGYNCCLFAYGQTGSGKSYSMIGYGANKGIIPIVCDQIFKKIKSNTDKNRTFQVMISMMEIYNQAVRDLLQKGKKKELKICQHKKLGVYVDGLHKSSVCSYDEIAKKIEQGSNNRSIAATLMNESSSRSHTIVSISFVQKIQLSASQTSIKYSTINLVDLAGSQCVAKTGVDNKDRLRQTAKINQSLSTLGRVIEILAQNSSRIDKIFVPYRDSKLTFILRNALGGNSRTAMICAISPADDNYEQTISTLRYASRAKKIQNKAEVNESDVDKLIRMLREQNQMLKKMLQQAKFTKTVINQQVISNFNRMSQNMVEFGIMSQQQQHNILGGFQIDSGMDKINQDDEDSLLNSSIISPQFLGNSIKSNEPYITNISQDQLLSFRIKYSCQNLLIGNKNGNPKPDVILAALGIKPNHARIFTQNQDNIKKVFLQIIDDGAEDYMYINGQTAKLKEKNQLFDNDRLIFGTGCIFIVIISGGKQRSTNIIKIEQIDYQFALNEMQNILNVKSSVGQMEQQIRKKIVQEIQKQYESVKKSNEEQMEKQIKKQQQNYQSKLKQIQDKKNEQTQRLKKQLEQKLQLSKKLQEEKNNVQQEIKKYKQAQLKNQVEQQNTKQEDKEQAQKQQLRNEKLLNLKLLQISDLQEKIKLIQSEKLEKEQQVKNQIFKQEQQIQKQLQIKTIICHNENILNQYRLQLNKKLKNSKELKDLLIKKQKAYLQKQLVQLVPMVERFNLMAKQMKRFVEAGLSVQYKYISDGQAIDVLKNNSYKSKLTIMIHIINRQEKRSYYWTVQIFKNRFQHAIQYFQTYIKSNGKSTIQETKDKYRDPYWEPEGFQIIGFAYLSTEILLYQFCMEDTLSIVNHGKKIGSLKVKIYPVSVKGQNIAIDLNIESDNLKIFNPRDLIERSLYFTLQIQKLQIQNQSKGTIEKIKLQYQVLQSNYKNNKYSSEEIKIQDLKNFKYYKMHNVKDISENTILHYSDKPIQFNVLALIRLEDTDELTNRESFTSKGTSFGVTSSFSMSQINGKQQNTFKNLDDVQITNFIQVSPPQNLKALKSKQRIKEGIIMDNTQMMLKIENEYNRKKKQDQKREKDKQKQTQSIQKSKQKKKRRLFNLLIKKYFSISLLSKKFKNN